MTLAYDMAVATNKAREEGWKEGREKGRKEGIAIGEKLGEKRGRQKALETARNLITLGLSQDQIASVTGLSAEEIDKL